MARHAAQDKQVREHVDDVGRVELARNPDGQALPGELVDDIERAELAAIVRAVLDKVVRPDVIAVLRAQADAGAVPEPEASLFRLLGRYLEPLASPMRSTRLSFTNQPASRSSAAILR